MKTYSKRELFAIEYLKALNIAGRIYNSIDLLNAYIEHCRIHSIESATIARFFNLANKIMKNQHLSEETVYIGCPGYIHYNIYGKVVEL
jgi:hypothetical protein